MTQQELINIATSISLLLTIGIIWILAKRVFRLEKTITTIGAYIVSKEAIESLKKDIENGKL